MFVAYLPKHADNGASYWAPIQGQRERHSGVGWETGARAARPPRTSGLPLACAARISHYKNAPPLVRGPGCPGAPAGVVFTLAARLSVGWAQSLGQSHCARPNRRAKDAQKDDAKNTCSIALFTASASDFAQNISQPFSLFCVSVLFLHPAAAPLCRLPGSGRPQSVFNTRREPMTAY